MKTGTIDVRSRDGKRHGKLRIPAVADIFSKEIPNQSEKYDRFYKKAFDPSQYYNDDDNLSADLSADEEKKEPAGGQAKVSMRR